MKQPSLNQLQAQVEKFNAKYSVGDKVKVQQIKGDSETFTDTIYQPATIMGGHTAMAWLKEKGSYDLTHVVGKA